MILPALSLAEANLEKAYENALYYLKGGQFDDAVEWFKRVMEDPKLGSKARLHALVIKLAKCQALSTIELAYRKGFLKAPEDDLFDVTAFDYKLQASLAHTSLKIEVAETAPLLSIWPKLSGGGILKGSSRSEVRI